MVREDSGVLVRELYQKNAKVYKYWHADFFRCPCCGIEVVADFADRPLATCFEDDKMLEFKKAAKYEEGRGRLFDWKEGPC